MLESPEARLYVPRGLVNVNFIVNSRRLRKTMFVSKHRRFAATAVFMLFCSAASLMKGQDLPKAPQAQVFTITPAPGFFTEPAIAVNPANPRQVVGVFQDNVKAAYSQDAGQTWQLAENVDP